MTTKTYVISLRPPTDDLRARLVQAGLEPAWIPGIDGRTAAPEDVQAHVTPLFHRFGPKGAIGCALSHLQTWQAFLETGQQWCLVVEDDVVLVPDFAKQLAAVRASVPADADVVYLGCFGCDSSWNPITVGFSAVGLGAPTLRKVNEHISKPGVAMATHGYLLSRAGARKLVTELDGAIHNHIDFCMQALAHVGAITRYVAQPRLMFQTSTDGAPSLNAPNTHPFLLNKLLSYVYLDQGMRMSYSSTVSLARIGPFDVTCCTLLFLALGVLAACYCKHMPVYLALYVLVSIPDATANVLPVLFHLGVFVLPSLVRGVV